jgi:hypothetical protein
MEIEMRGSSLIVALRDEQYITGWFADYLNQQFAMGIRLVTTAHGWGMEWRTVEVYAYRYDRIGD